MIRYTVNGKVVEITYALEAGHHVYRADAYRLQKSGLKKQEVWKAFNEALKKVVK